MHWSSRTVKYHGSPEPPATSRHGEHIVCTKPLDLARSTYPMPKHTSVCTPRAAQCYRKYPAHCPSHTRKRTVEKTVLRTQRSLVMSRGSSH